MIDAETGRRRRVLLFWFVVAWVVKTATIGYWLGLLWTHASCS